jgi:N,N'-diacetyllegionaminate synthase
MNRIEIGNKSVGDKSPAYIIAEAGSNFSISSDPKTNYKHALKLIDIAAEANADAVKFQLYRSNKLYVKSAGEANYLNNKEDIGDLIKKLELPSIWLPKLKKYCDKKDIEFLCSPFDESSVDELEGIGISAFKIASYSISHIPLLKYVAKIGKPIILSSGASTLEEIKFAINAIKSQGNSKIAILQCTAKYPSPLSDINLKVIPELKKKFDLPTGLSDHSREANIAPLGAVALGANIIEKHFTTDNNLSGPDHIFAILPEELKNMVKNIRMLESALGNSEKEVSKCEEELRNFARRYIYASQDIKKGEIFTKENLEILRSGKAEKGLDPSKFDMVLNKISLKYIKKGSPIKEDSYE